MGILSVVSAGLISGSGMWPFKLMRMFRFEHWYFVATFLGLIVLPWTATLAGCPHALRSLQGVPTFDLIKGNLFSVGFGLGSVMGCLSYTRIGVGLTGAILLGLSVSLGAILPMSFKGSGLFQNAPNLASPAGVMVLGGVAVMLVGVVLTSVAGFGHDRQLRKKRPRAEKFLTGLLMAIAAGILTAFMPFAFVYTQGPIIANLSVVEPAGMVAVAVDGDAELSGWHQVAADGTITLKNIGLIEVGGLSAQEASWHIQSRLDAAPSSGGRVLVTTGSVPATFGAFAAGLFGGAIVCVAFAAYLLTRNRSWGVFLQSRKETALAAIMGVNTCLSIAMMFKGMLLLGALGASIGYGIYGAMSIAGMQSLSFISGEWRGVHGRPRMQMYAAIGLFIAAVGIMTYARTLSKV
jgi:hypothetical protein